MNYSRDPFLAPLQRLIALSAIYSCVLTKKRPFPNYRSRRCQKQRLLYHFIASERYSFLPRRTVLKGGNNSPRRSDFETLLTSTIPNGFCIIRRAKSMIFENMNIFKDSFYVIMQRLSKRHFKSLGQWKDSF